MTADMVARFWGVRGSTPVPGPETVRYGGNTSCVELRCGAHRVILDAGTGLRRLGESLHGAEEGEEADLLITHPHLDHLMGLPFFKPLYRSRYTLRLWLPQLVGDEARDYVAGLINPPYFPVPIEQMGARIERRGFMPGEALALREGLSVRTIGVHHPGGAVGLRIEYEGCALVYLTDLEIMKGRTQDLVDFSALADVMICDAMFTEDEILSHAGWGHSSWQDAVQLAKDAKVSKLILFHHAPGRSDRALDEIGWKAATLLPGTEIASEGLSIRIG